MFVEVKPNGELEAELKKALRGPELLLNNQGNHKGA